MKQFLSIILTLATISVWAQDNSPRENDKVWGNYKYQIIVGSNPENTVESVNEYINSNQGNTRGWADLGTAISTAYKSSITQKTVNATSNLLSLGVSYVTALVQKPSKDFESWAKTKEKQCTYKNDLDKKDWDLPSNEIIDDFYYRPSTNGALDPRDLKFNGFSCRNFIETQGKNPSSQQDTTKKDRPRIGRDVFYVSCKLRTDSLGKAHLVNHSKFLLELDSLAFIPKYCNIPNNTPKLNSDAFNFDAYTNLEFEMRIKVLSSWINEAIMITTDYQLGEFIIRAKIDESTLQTIGENRVFIYDKNNPKINEKVNIIGESFIVPRSYVGTTANNEQLWGTGQYKLEITVSQTCQLNADYYLKEEQKDKSVLVKIDEVGNGRAINFANLPGYKKWNKDIWKEEWRTMEHRKSNDPFLTNVWKEIKTAYWGDNWVKELADPAVTQLLLHETKELQGLLNLDANTQVKSTTTSTPNVGNTNNPPKGNSQPTMPTK